MTTAGAMIRWVHVIAGAAWLGAVVMVVFVLVPSAGELREPERGRFLERVFPKVFRLASVLSVTVVAAGVVLYLERFGWRLRLSPLVSSRWGWSILAGASLALLLTTFHFFAESRLAPHVKGAATTPADPFVLRVLQIAPRVGLTILVSVFILMAYAARGL